jgi:holo-[acyl-carrier protein] synthase
VSGPAEVDGPQLAVGCDVVDVSRLAAAIDRQPGFLARVFTDRELADARRGGVEPGSPTERERLAARFAAKEATRKALGDLRLPFHDAEVRTGDDGAPHLHVRGAPSTLTCSLSHDGGVAMAVVIGFRPAPSAALLPPLTDDA